MARFSPSGGNDDRRPIVGQHLVLLDTATDLIVDDILNAIVT